MLLPHLFPDGMITDKTLGKRAVFLPLDQAIHLSINKDYRIHHNIQNEPFFRWKNISTAADSKKRRCRFKLFHPIHSSFIKLRFFFLAAQVSKCKCATDTVLFYIVF